MKMNETGLTKEEVNQRIAKGQVNDYVSDTSKSNKDIIFDNVFTLFNLLNVIIAICLALVGAYSNMFFMAIIILNVVIGVSQEIRAKNLVAQLSIVNEENVDVYRDNQKIGIPTTELVMDDIVILSAGQQVPSDTIIVSGNVEVNESLLTGEADLIKKGVDSQLMSGSYVTSGQCVAKVIHVGKDNYAIKIAEEAKIHKPVTSELVQSIRKVAKFTSYIIIPLGVILFLEAYFLRNSDIKLSVVSSAAALLGMLPKGMVLLISIALATGVVKLTKKKVLVQDMHSIETLAHVDVLCLDKTGTITQGNMIVSEVIDLASKNSQIDTNKLMGNYINATDDNNLTMQALRSYFKTSNDLNVLDVLPFSSDRKWGAVLFEGIGCVYLGAPERLVSESSIPTEVMQAQEQGSRVLLIGIDAQATQINDTVGSVDAQSVLIIEDAIRENAEETLAYLDSEGVALKVISGDNPITVSNVARRAGLKNYEQYIDLSTIKTEEAVKQIVDDYTVFGRVSPQQKKWLVEALRQKDHIVAMTGDGVNDILAMKEADCSIAMAEGDNATRQMANLVLLNSDFTTLPDVLFEGRRVVNNVTKVASIFFIKTIYSFILSIICMVAAIGFPFIPIQITLLDLAIEGYPTFFLSFESDKRKITTKFLPTALRRALPNALLVVINILVIYFISPKFGISGVDQTTLMYYMLIAVSSMAVIKACLPFNPLRLFLAVTTTVGTFVAAMLFKSLLEITWLNATTLPIFIVLVICSILGKLILDKLITGKMGSFN
ncbi:HAD-IC family P-type ATPase [Vagococcus teuberi]|uniref:ATPase n=1 Tax=Vagococcus teuberi TaxID=519472 RepID=A0A1J0A5W4_9ENTE|nr:cation-translocating P-type ATPase [Vagococcus teuberi]APB31326.1 ATPase [Vagococcus teuberi]